MALALKGAGVTATVHSVEPENFDGMQPVAGGGHARARRPAESSPSPMR